VVVDAVAADFIAATAVRAAHTIGIVAVHLVVAVVVDAVVADFVHRRRAAAIGAPGACRVEAIGDAVAVVVGRVVATFGSEGVHVRIAVVAIRSVAVCVFIAVAIAIGSTEHTSVRHAATYAARIGADAVVVGHAGGGAATGACEAAGSSDATKAGD